MAYFAAARRSEELIALCWYLEAGSRRYYAGISGSSADPEIAALFAQLAQAEERHMGTLSELAGQAGSGAPAASFPQGVIRQEPPDAVMEGGVEVIPALDWSRGQPQAALVEYALSLEVNSYDLYLRMHRATEGTAALAVFSRLAGEEQRHLQQLEAVLGRLFPDGVRPAQHGTPT